MNPQDELLDIIDTYLNNGMAEKERIAFEEILAYDEKLADKVNEVRLTNEAIYYASLAELKNTIGKDVKQIKYKEPFNWKKASYISIASLALVSGIATYFIANTDETTSGKPDTLKSAGEVNKPSAQEGNASMRQNVVIDNKSNTGHLSEKQKIKDSVQTAASSAQKTITSTDDKAQHVEKTKIADPEIQNQTNNSIPVIKQSETLITENNKVICDKSFKINTEASCKEKETGSIQIISDGAYTYTFQVDIRSTSGSKGMFTDMPAGVYEIMVTYGKECTYKKQVAIAEKWCPMNESYSFNPDYNQKWVFNYEAGASGTFTIFDKSGKNIYSNTFGTGNEEWNGNDREGSPAPVGVYFAFINYSDGRKEKVELTIVR